MKKLLVIIIGLTYITVTYAKTPNLSNLPEIFSIKAIGELSGFVFDTISGDLFSVADSGNGAKLGVTHLNTFKTEISKVKNAFNLDWEAVVQDQESNLWILDVGDNRKIRPYVTIYMIDKNALQTQNKTITVSRKIRFSYPDGPRNVEAAFFEGTYLYLVEKKVASDPKLAFIDISSDWGVIQIATECGIIPGLSSVTDASVSPSGNVYILTYFGVYQYNNATNQNKRSIKQLFSGDWKQAESLIALSDNNFFVGNEEGQIFQWKNGQFVDKYER